jgi:hypothetical protein
MAREGERARGREGVRYFGLSKALKKSRADCPETVSDEAKKSGRKIVIIQIQYWGRCKVYILFLPLLCP